MLASHSETYATAGEASGTRLDERIRPSATSKTGSSAPITASAPAQLPVYLDEFVFRHNRRRTPQAAFQTLLGLGMNRAPTTYEQILRGGGTLGGHNPNLWG
jgi:hypothetical protein